MEMDQYLVGVDCGTQSAKVAIVDGAGRVVAEGRQALRPMERPRPGVVLHPDDDLWAAICAASRQAVDAFPHDPARIVAMGICPIRCCKAFLAADGSLVEPVMSWMDDRAYRPYLPGPAGRGPVRWATTASGYIAHRCTGLHRDTAANCIDIQWPIDTDTWDWSDDPAAYERHGIRRELLFDLQMPGDVIGPLTRDAAASTGLPVGIPVVHTANDKAVEMLGTGVFGDRRALISLGTYIAAMVQGPRNHPAPQHFWTNFASIPNRYLHESNGIRRGMWTLTWFLDLLGPEVAERAASLGLTREEHLEREACGVPAGSDGLMTVLDWLAPADRPFRRGAMLGFDARHRRGHVYRSILEAIAMTMRLNVDAMCGELGIGLDEIVLSGGGAASPLFTQIFADVFGCSIGRSADRGGASLGAAMCAAAGAGMYPSVEAAAEAMAGPRHVVTPDPANVGRYRELMDAFAGIRDHTDPFFERAVPSSVEPHQGMP